MDIDITLKYQRSIHIISSCRYNYSTAALITTLCYSLIKSTFARHSPICYSTKSAMLYVLSGKVTGLSSATILSAISQGELFAARFAVFVTIKVNTIKKLFCICISKLLYGTFICTYFYSQKNKIFRYINEDE